MSASVPAGITTDLAGNARLRDESSIPDTGPGSPPVVDMGAYEVQGASSTIFVNAAATGTNSGDSWSNAFTDLQDALAAVGSCDGEIWVAAGTYFPDSGTLNRGATFDLVNDVVLLGGFAGGETLSSERDPSINLTILSGDLASDDSGTLNNHENSYHVVPGSGTSRSTVLDGFIVRGGNADDATEKSGAGLYNSNGSPSILNCIFENNVASTDGGGIYNTTSSSPEIIDCVFRKNSAGSGGGIFNNDSSSPAFTNCVFSGNSANFGGGIGTTNNSRPTITNSNVVGNTALSGGGLHNGFLSSSTVTNSILWENSDSGGMDEGAQITDSSSTTSTVSYSMIQNWFRLAS